MVRRSIEGRTHICRLDARPMHAGMEWIRHYEKYWNERLDVLQGLLEAEVAAEKRARERCGRATARERERSHERLRRTHRARRRAHRAAAARSDRARLGLFHGCRQASPLDRRRRDRALRRRPRRDVVQNASLSDKGDLPPPKYAGNGGKGRILGKVVACEPPHLLVYHWEHGGGEPSEVRIELEERGDKVLSTLTHERLPTRDWLLSVSAGWHTHLDILAARLAGEAPSSFWRTMTGLETVYEKRIPSW